MSQNLQLCLKIVNIVLVLSLVQQQVSSKTRSHVSEETIEPIQVANRYGSKSLRISGGFFAEEGQFPSHVTLRFKKSDGQQGYCGAVLISNRTLLTAGHCIAGKSSFKVDFNGIELDSPGTISRNVSQACLHPAYSRNENGDLVNDLGVLTLLQPIEYSEKIQPVKICEECKLTEGTKVYATGYGRVSLQAKSGSKFLKYLPMYLKSCIDKPKTMFCIESEGNGVTCKGDSGSPLYTEINGKITLIGVHSMGHKHSCFPTSANHSMNTILYQKTDNIKKLIKLCSE